MFFKSALACVLLVIADAGHWAVLVAGSNGYWNYRHQADVCHAYQLLIRNGIPDSNIITMFYDDIATDPLNPFPGQIFNRPSSGEGLDVYKGCKKSYTGSAVTANNFFNVLRGNASGIHGGSGEVLQSNSNDEVFVYFADHGATGLIAMPVGPFVYADDLNVTLQYMKEMKMFDKLTFYLEACESGSMFSGILPDSVSVYSTTAANSYESSWGTYCYPNDMINGTHINSCLGDLYSVNWMENAENTDGESETLQQQYYVVRNQTNLSHVCQFGDMSFTNWTIGTFEGSTPAPLQLQSSSADNVVKHSWDARNATLMALKHLFNTHQDDIKFGISTEMLSQQRRNYLMESVAMHLSETTLQKPLHQALGRHVDVQNWSCYKAANEHIMNDYSCGPYTDYSLQFARVVAQMCNVIPLEKVLHHLDNSCTAALASII